MASTEKLLPVTLPTWPTCNDCLTWSEDDLAVAGGDFVYVLTEKSSLSRSAITGHPQWKILNLRVNLFQPDEWSEQTLASINQLSIGEEQSNSQVVALGWSNSGLGLHRRSVLGVLTSNLVLSIWENNGGQSTFQRTFIVNKSIIDTTSTEEDKDIRLAQRIRSFAWLSLLKIKGTNKWGLHYIVVALDNKQLVVLQASKKNTTSLGNWKYEVALRMSFSELISDEVDVNLMSPLQQRLYEQSPITKISTSSWHKVDSSSERIVSSNGDVDMNADQELLICHLTITRANQLYRTTVIASVTSDGQEASLGLTRIPASQGSKSSAEGATRGQSQPLKIGTQTISEEYFKDATKQLRDDFDSTFRLFGNLRIRFYGMTVSLDKTKAVACVTLHPSDMIEYNIPSAEKSSLVFKHTGIARSTLPSTSKASASVQEDILKFVVDALRTNAAIVSLFDRKLLMVYLSLARNALEPDSLLRKALEARGDELDMSHENDPEECEVCGKSVPFTTETTSGVCHSGHLFSRCQLCFMTIQEPGISKYCSECGKEFLDLAKLGPISGPSFAQAVFEEFDVCPYCQAKFQG